MNKILSSLVLAVSAMAAQAAPVVTDIGTLTVSGYEYADVQSKKINWEGTNLGFKSFGGLNAVFDDGFDEKSFVAFCVELDRNLAAWGSTKAYAEIVGFNNATPKENTTFGALGKLFTFNGGTTSVDSAHSGAMQLAVWELLYDTTPGDLKSGDFKLDGTGINSQVNLANALLAGAAGVSTNLYDVYLYSDNGLNPKNSNKFQDVISASLTKGSGDTPPIPVPEPSTYALMLAGLAAMAFISRRKSKV